MFSLTARTVPFMSARQLASNFRVAFYGAGPLGIPRAMVRSGLLQVGADERLQIDNRDGERRQKDVGLGLRDAQTALALAVSILFAQPNGHGSGSHRHVGPAARGFGAMDRTILRLKAGNARRF